MDQSNQHVGMILGKMLNELFRVLKKRAGGQTEAKLTLEQFGLLFAISREEQEVIQKDMAEILGKDKSAILRMIDSLEKKDLVRRVVDKNDRRKNNIMVSKKGERIIEQYLEIEKDLNMELMEGLSQPEIDSFYKVVNHIRHKAELLNTKSIE